MSDEQKPVAAPATEAPAATPAAAAAPRRRLKKKRQVVRGQAHILATYNNTHVALTDQGGNVLVSFSSGRAGFKGPRKATPYAAGMVVRNAVERAKEYGMRDVDVLVKGVGVGREAAIRALYANGLNVISIKDITPVPHNGCRPRRPRRV